MNLGSYLLALLAGVLTTFSPCVLPLLPLVIAASLNSGRRGPVFFTIGLLITFVGFTWLFSSFGSFLGLDREGLRNFSAIVLVFAGLLFLSERLQELFSKLLSPLVNRLSKNASQLNQSDFLNRTGFKQIFIGALTGVIWTPCSGPSLGLAIGLAAEQKNVIQSLVLLTIFGIGAALPIIVIAYGSVSITKSLRALALNSGVVKKGLGVLILVVGVAILTGVDKKFEAILVSQSPDWLSDLTTRY